MSATDVLLLVLAFVVVLSLTALFLWSVATGSFERMIYRLGDFLDTIKR